MDLIGSGGGADLAEGAQLRQREVDGNIWSPCVNVRDHPLFGNVSLAAPPVVRTVWKGRALPKRGNVSDPVPPILTKSQTKVCVKKLKKGSSRVIAELFLGGTGVRFPAAL